MEEEKVWRWMVADRSVLVSSGINNIFRPGLVFQQDKRAVECKYCFCDIFLTFHPPAATRPPLPAAPPKTLSQNSFISLLGTVGRLLSPSQTKQRLNYLLSKCQFSFVFRQAHSFFARAS